MLPHVFGDSLATRDDGPAVSGDDQERVSLAAGLVRCRLLRLMIAEHVARVRLVEQMHPTKESTVSVAVPTLLRDDRQRRRRIRIPERLV